MKTPNNSELVGQQINNLLVLSKAEPKIRPNGKKRPVYFCKCTLCGTVITVESQTLRSSKKLDCGCESGNRRRQTYEARVLNHLGPEHHYRAKSSYAHMIDRCYNPKEQGYERYGGRGISVCERWRNSFWDFLEDLGERPEGFVLDRIDPNLDYSPENCRWVDRKTSSYNTRRHVTNTTGRTGVYWFSRVNKWTAAIFINGVQTHLGYFETFESACKAREVAELKHFGEIKYGDRNATTCV